MVREDLPVRDGSPRRHAGGQNIVGLVHEDRRPHDPDERQQCQCKRPTGHQHTHICQLAHGSWQSQPCKRKRPAGGDEHGASAQEHPSGAGVRCDGVRRTVRVGPTNQAVRPTRSYTETDRAPKRLFPVYRLPGCQRLADRVRDVRRQRAVVDDPCNLQDAPDARARGRTRIPEQHPRGDVPRDLRSNQPDADTSSQNRALWDSRQPHHRERPPTPPGRQQLTDTGRACGASRSQQDRLLGLPGQ